MDDQQSTPGQAFDSDAVDAGAPAEQGDAPDRSPVTPETQRGTHTGDPEDNPEHNTAPDGQPGTLPE